MDDTSLESQIGFVTAMRDVFQKSGQLTEGGKDPVACAEAVLETLRESEGGGGRNLPSSAMVALAALVIRSGGRVMIPNSELDVMLATGMYAISAEETDDGLAITLIDLKSSAMAH